MDAQGVARAQDLTPEQVIKGKKIIDMMIEAGVKAAADKAAADKAAAK